MPKLQNIKAWKQRLKKVKKKKKKKKKAVLNLLYDLALSLRLLTFNAVTWVDVYHE
jgi:hypothetical protein